MAIGDVVSVPSLAVDGHLGQTLRMDGPLSGRCLIVIADNPWFVLDLGISLSITRIVIYARDRYSMYCKRISVVCFPIERKDFTWQTPALFQNSVFTPVILLGLYCATLHRNCAAMI